MTDEERIETAAALKRDGKCNCAQAVLKVFSDKISLDEKDMMNLSSGFAAGMGSMEATCGALIGAVMAAGLIKEGKGAPALARAILEKFREKSGALVCRELKGIESGKVLCPCPDCVRNAVSSLLETLRES